MRKARKLEEKSDWINIWFNYTMGYIYKYTKWDIYIYILDHYTILDNKQPLQRIR